MIATLPVTVAPQPAPPPATGGLTFSVDPWRGNLSGDVKIGHLLFLDEKNDLTSDLAMDDEDTIVPAGIGYYVPGGGGLSFDFFVVDFDGSLHRPETFGGTVNRRFFIDTTLDIQKYSLKYHQPFLDFDWVRLGLIGGVDYVLLKTRSLARPRSRDPLPDDFDADLGGHATLDAPAPILGAELWVDLFGNLRLQADVSGSLVDYSGIEGSFLDARGGLVYHFERPAIHFGLGYRYFMADFEDSDDLIDVALDGATLSFGITFVPR